MASPVGSKSVRRVVVMGVSSLQYLISCRQLETPGCMHCANTAGVPPAPPPVGKMLSCTAYIQQFDWLHNSAGGCSDQIQVAPVWQKRELTPGTVGR